MSETNSKVPKVTCDCGSVIAKNMMKRHLNTAKHRNIMEKLNSTQNQNEFIQEPQQNSETDSDSEIEVVDSRTEMLKEAVRTYNSAKGLKDDFFDSINKKDEDDSSVSSESESDAEPPKNDISTSSDLDFDSTDEEEEHVSKDNQFHAINGDAFDEFIYLLRMNYGIRTQKQMTDSYNFILGATNTKPKQLTNNGLHKLGGLIQKFQRSNKNIKPELLRDYMRYVLSDY